MTRSLFSICLLILISFSSVGQSPRGWTSAEMYQALRKLNVLGSVLYIAAHPDDENTRLITYLSKEKLYRTGYLSLTRGDGGQNLIGNEQGIELGQIRTQELLSARRIDGGEQFFSRAFDFGYSKGPEETFTKWDREKILSDVVWVIRNFQPDIIITRFPTTGEGGHGHHTASAILANEAFTAAADPKRFPEQLKYVEPWQAKRIMWNTFNFSGAATPVTPDQFRVDVGGYNPLLGQSYGEIAALSRSQHKSQGFGVPATRGESFENFKTTGGTAPASDLMDGIDISWTRIPGFKRYAVRLSAIIDSFDVLQPAKSVPALVEYYGRLKNLPASVWKNKKMHEVQELIEQCSGLFMEATASSQFAVQTDSIRINFSFNSRLSPDITIKRVRVDEFDSAYNAVLGVNKNITFSKTIGVPLSKAITQPYWLENKMADGYYNVSDQLLIGRPDVVPAYSAIIETEINGEQFTITRPVQYKFTDPVKGEIYEPLVVIPPVSVRVFPEIAVSKQGGKEVDYTLTLTSFKKQNDLKLQEMKTQKSIFSGIIDKGNAKTIDQIIPFPLSAQKQPTITMTDTSTYQYNDGVTAFHLNTIRYDHIPYVVYFNQAKAVRKFFNYSIYGKKVGYIVGAGDKVPEALEQMGYEVSLLTDKELGRINLQQFDAIITGVRAYNTNEWLNAYYDKLMSYVKEGGNLIVQYNTSNNLGTTRSRISPYNFEITRTRITDENAAVNFLKPEHPVLNFPNKLLPADFTGWVQERSIYHAGKLDNNFESILSMQDKGEALDSGSLVIAKYGKGYFTYTGLVFFRELPAGVPSAYRLMANLIALNRKKAF
jgi:LmbE family N-acetylglucosaminyl deacetylase